MSFLAFRDAKILFTVHKCRKIFLTSILTSIFLKKLEKRGFFWQKWEILPLSEGMRKPLETLMFQGVWGGRARRTRTLNKGFGDQTKRTSNALIRNALRHVSFSKWEQFGDNSVISFHQSVFAPYFMIHAFYLNRSLKQSIQGFIAFRQRKIHKELSYLWSAVALLP